MNKEASSFIEEVQETAVNQENENVIISYGEFPNKKMIASDNEVYGITYNNQFSEKDAENIQVQIKDCLDNMGIFIMNLANVGLLCTSESILPVILQLAQILAPLNIKLFVIPHREDYSILPELFVKKYGVEYGDIFEINNINTLISMLSLPAIDAKEARENGGNRISPDFLDYYKQIQVAMSNYEFLKMLGVGSFGFVALIMDKSTKKKYALKILYRHEYPFIVDFIEEAKLLMYTHRQNPYTLQCYDVDFVLLENKRCALYQILEYHEQSVTLKKYLKKLAQKDMQKTRYIRLLLMREIVIAVYHFVTYAVHWDLKPSNIMVKEEKDAFRCWILDLGFSKEIDYAVYTKGLGTVHYIPPREQDEWAINPFFRDLFALCIILFEVYTGYDPFSGITETSELENAKLSRNVEGMAKLDAEDEQFMNKFKFMMDTKLRHKPISSLLKKALRIIDNKIGSFKREDK